MVRRHEGIWVDVSSDAFSALIPRKNLSLFPDVQSFEGKWLTVKGYLENYKGKPQVILSFPLQIKRGDYCRDSLNLEKRCLAPFLKIDRSGCLFYKAI